MDIWVKPNSSLTKVRGSPVWEGCAWIATNDTTTPAISPLNKQGLTVLAVESIHHGLHIRPRKYIPMSSNAEYSHLS
jgi:hypothetical protein